MRALGVTISILLVLAALVMLGLGSLDLAKLNQGQTGSEDHPDDRIRRLETAESAMAYFFGCAVCGLAAFFLTFAAYRAAARDRAAAERALAEHETRMRDREERARLTEEEAERNADGSEDAGTPKMTLDDLLEALDQDDPDQRIQVARMIRDLAPPADEASPPLMTLLENDAEDLHVLRAVALSLIEILGNPSPAVMSVARRLGHDDPKVRDWAAVTLGLIGSPALSAVGPLIDVLHDPRVGSTAAEALRRIGGPEARAALRGDSGGDS